jgi:hypothetical protein
MKKIAAIALLAVCAGQAWAVNKCTLPDGRITFQDAPCAGSATGELIKIRPASGYVSAPPEAPQPAATSGTPNANTETPKPKNQLQKMQEQLANSQNDRKRQELEVRVSNTSLAMNKNATECDQQLNELKEQKKLAKNNLAGATWEQSLSTEMQAIAGRCDTRARELQTTLDDAKKECKALGGCK